VETPIPDRTELVKRAGQLIPLLRARAEWTEQNRRLHDESLGAMTDAGLFKMRVPVRYGGYECDTRTLVDVLGQIGQGDGSAAWTASVWWIATWMVGLFPDTVQDEVFATPDVRVCGTLSPGARAEAKDGGVVVSGQWGFITGALHSQWQVIIAVSVTPDGSPMPVMALVPTSDLDLVDDWYVSGLRGSGSVTTVAREVFIPAERVLPLPLVLQEQYASKLNSGAPIFRAPLIPTASATSVGTVVGLARAAREVFHERLPGRKITYTAYDNQREAPLTHLQVAEAFLKTTEAEFHAHQLASLVDDKSLGDQPWTIEERARARVHMGRACQLGREAVEVLRRASGGSSIYSSVPIQRIARDAEAIGMHALMHPDTNYELYGRVSCGLEPNSFYL
jgi:alkylation response protein AidB-like acyl-CoA dehydrogenase